MGKKPELSKELKRSSDKAQKRYVKAYAKALDKHGDEKKARKKAQKKLEKKYELVGKKYEKISDKPQAAPKGKGKDAAAPSTGKGKKGAEKGTKSAARREAELILAETAESLEEAAGYEEILDTESLELVNFADFNEDLTTEPLTEAPAQEDAASAPDQQDDDNQTFLVAEARPLAELTRAELYELAKQLEVPGRSSMNKGDLLIAVRAAQ